MALTIRVRRNGPYVIDADDLTVVNWEGNVCALPAKRPIALCRCGASASKPFCDGTHSRAGFQPDDQAERDATGH